MGMTYTIKDANGNMLFAVEGAGPVNSEKSIESMSNEISNESAKILNSLEKFSLIADTRAMESFGYYSLESEEGKAKKENIFKRIGRAIVNFFKKIIAFFRKIIDKIVSKFNNMRAKHAAAKMLKKMAGPEWKKGTRDEKKAVIKAETNRILNVIESPKMGKYVLAKKYASKLEAIQKKINGALTNGREFKDKQFVKWEDFTKKELKKYEDEATYISQNEKTKYAIAFYKEVASSGCERIKADLKKKVSEAEQSKRLAEQKMDAITTPGAEADPDAAAVSAIYQINVAVWKFYTDEESIASSLLSGAMAGSAATEFGGTNNMENRYL